MMERRAFLQMLATAPAALVPINLPSPAFSKDDGPKVFGEVYRGGRWVDLEGRDICGDNRLRISGLYPRVRGTWESKELLIGVLGHDISLTVAYRWDFRGGRSVYAAQRFDLVGGRALRPETFTGIVPTDELSKILAERGR